MGRDGTSDDHASHVADGAMFRRGLGGGGARCCCIASACGGAGLRRRTASTARVARQRTGPQQIKGRALDRCPRILDGCQRVVEMMFERAEELPVPTVFQAETVKLNDFRGASPVMVTLADVEATDMDPTSRPRPSNTQTV